ncbi:MAG: hypothetical protein RBS40_13540 [Rhodocyclaceae bacterium]|jgi:hypothetical protein|nr:hypothetical protein [Rhodocyclaceae bacterium]
MEKISIEQIITGDEDLSIISGEGEQGTREDYDGPRTVAAIRKALKKERCGGDRWAYITDGQFRAEDA